MMASFRNACTVMPPISQLLARHLAKPASNWSVGELGMLAEFQYHGASQQQAFLQPA